MSVITGDTNRIPTSLFWWFRNTKRSAEDTTVHSVDLCEPFSNKNREAFEPI